MTSNDEYVVQLLLERGFLTEEQIEAAAKSMKAENETTLDVLVASGALTEDDYSESLITKARINFRPGSALVGILSNLSFAKVKVRSSKADKEAEEGEPEGGV